MVTPAQSLEYLARLGQLPIAVDAVTPISRRDSVIELARRYGVSAYDASYLELAIRTGGPLATFDRNLAKAAETAGIEVTEPPSLLVGAARWRSVAARRCSS